MQDERERLIAEAQAVMASLQRGNTVDRTLADLVRVLAQTAILLLQSDAQRKPNADAKPDADEESGD